jgi:hypothetical protein
MDAGRISHACTAGDAGKCLIWAAADIFVDCQQQPGLQQVERWATLCMDLCEQGSGSDMERIIVDVRGTWFASVGASLQRWAGMRQTHGQDKDRKTGRRSNTRGNKIVLEAEAGDDGIVAMDALEIARADMVDEQAHGMHGALDEEMEISLGRGGNGWGKGEALQRAQRRRNYRNGKTRLPHAEGRGDWSVMVSAPQALPAGVRCGQRDWCRR